MKKSHVIRFISKNVDSDILNTKNTTFAQISNAKNAWWMNIKLKNFEKEWNILLVSNSELFWLKIPANTFQDLSSFFQIWESKNAVDIYISCDPYDRYFQDIASKGSGVDFRQFLFQKFAIPEELKIDSLEISKKEENRSSQEKFNLCSIMKRELKSGQRILKENEANVSYKSLFGDYLKGAKNIIIQDPYIRYPHRFKNLLEFCWMLGENKDTGEEINLEIVTWNSEELYSQSKGYFDEVVGSVSDLNINLSYRFEEHHDRYIEADNGWKIILGRGLDIFKRPEGRFTIADIDQMSRKCKACEITFLNSSTKKN